MILIFIKRDINIHERMEEQLEEKNARIGNNFFWKIRAIIACIKNWSWNFYYEFLGENKKKKK